MQTRVYHKSSLTRQSVVLSIFLATGIIFPSIDVRGLDLGQFRKEKGQLIQYVGENSYINWTGGYIATSASVKIPEIVFDPQDPEFASPGTERSISDARARALSEAQNRAILDLNRLVLALRLDSHSTVRQRMESSRDFRDRMGDLSSRYVTRSRRVGEGTVTVDLLLPLYREEGLYSMLIGSSYGQEAIPTVEEGEQSDEITGIIIDATTINGFKLSLETRLFTDQGRQIYGPEQIRPGVALAHGLVTPYTDYEAARRDPRIGIHPFYTFAAGASGPNRGNLFLDPEDVGKILSSKSGRSALRRGAVVIITNPASGIDSASGKRRP